MNAHDHNPNNVLITGANGGLGGHTIRALLEDGVSTITMAVRSRERGEHVRTAILDELEDTDGVSLEVADGFDMTDPDAIAAAVAALPDRPFDVVFLQAGGVVFTDDYQWVHHRGRQYERTVFQNVFGAHLVLSSLLRRGLVAPGARVVFAGGEGARGIPGLIAKPHFADGDALRAYLQGSPAAPYHPMNAIGVSKLLGALWTDRIAREYGAQFSALWFSPGLTAGTRGLQSAPKVRRWFLEHIGFPIAELLGLAQSPRAGGRKYADALVGRIGHNGDIIGAPQGKALGKLTDQRPMNDDFGDAALEDALWAVLEDLDGPFGQTTTPPSRRTAI